MSVKNTERLADAGLEPSVGRVGDPYDNALAETINGLYKAELIRRKGPWRSLDAVEYVTLAWGDWSNDRRLLEPSATSRLPRQKPPTMRRWRKQLSLLNKSQTGSGVTGAVQCGIGKTGLLSVTR